MVLHGEFFIDILTHWLIITSCNSLKLEAADGKIRLTDIAGTKAKDYLKIKES